MLLFCSRFRCNPPSPHAPFRHLLKTITWLQAMALCLVFLDSLSSPSRIRQFHCHSSAIFLFDFLFVADMQYRRVFHPSPKILPKHLLLAFLSFLAIVIAPLFLHYCLPSGPPSERVRTTGNSGTVKSSNLPFGMPPGTKTTRPGRPTTASPTVAEHGPIARFLTSSCMSEGAQSEQWNSSHPPVIADYVYLVCPFLISSESTKRSLLKRRFNRAVVSRLKVLTRRGETVLGSKRISIATQLSLNRLERCAIYFSRPSANNVLVD